MGSSAHGLMERGERARGERVAGCTGSGAYVCWSGMRPIGSEPRPLNSPLFHSQSHRFPISVSRRRRRRLPLAGLRLNAEGSAPAGSTAALHLGQFISSNQTLLPASLGAAADRRTVS